MRAIPKSRNDLHGPGAIDRRTLLTALPGLLALAGSGRVIAATTFESFLQAANTVAADLVADRSAAGQDRYLRALAGEAAGLADVPMPERFNDSSQGLTPGSYRIGFNPGGETFRVLHWRLEPGAMCRPHAHTYGNVVTVGLEGTARIRNYEVVGRPDFESDGSFAVARTLEQSLGPGDVNLVSLERNYIHEFLAGPNGARGLDITTPLMPRPDFGIPYLEFLDDPDEQRPAYAARWAFE